MKKFIFSLVILLTSLQLDASKISATKLLSYQKKACIKMLEKIEKGETIIKDTLRLSI